MSVEAEKRVSVRSFQLQKSSDPHTICIFVYLGQGRPQGGDGLQTKDATARRNLRIFADLPH